MATFLYDKDAHVAELEAENERLRTAMREAYDLLDRAEVYDGQHFGVASTLTVQGYNDIFEDDGAHGVLGAALGVEA